MALNYYNVIKRGVVIGLNILRHQQCLVYNPNNEKKIGYIFSELENKNTLPEHISVMNLF